MTLRVATLLVLVVFVIPLSGAALLPLLTLDTCMYPQAGGSVCSHQEATIGSLGVSGGDLQTHGSASWGSLGAYASATNPATGGPSYTTTASLREAAMVTGTSFTQGYIEVPLTLEGSYQRGADYYSTGATLRFDSTLIYDLYCTHVHQNMNCWAQPIGGFNLSTSRRVYFNFNEWFNFTVTLGVGASAINGTAMTDASNTAELGPIRIYDLDGNDITDQVTFEAQSGHNYLATEAGGEVPEPGTFLLLGAGLKGLGLLWRRRRLA